MNELQEKLGLSKRTANALFRGHIFTLDDLKNSTQEDILDCRNIGPIQLTEVITKAKEHGIDIPEGAGLKYKFEWYKKAGYKAFLENPDVKTYPESVAESTKIKIVTTANLRAKEDHWDMEFTCGLCGNKAPVSKCTTFLMVSIDSPSKAIMICPDCAAKIFATVESIKYEVKNEA